MMPISDDTHEYCAGCVYYPPNLPESAYTKEDYKMLQLKSCSYDHHPEDENCQIMRKTSCSVIDLENLNKPI